MFFILVFNLYPEYSSFLVLKENKQIIHIILENLDSQTLSSVRTENFCKIN